MSDKYPHLTVDEIVLLNVMTSLLAGLSKDANLSPEHAERLHALKDYCRVQSTEDAASALVWADDLYTDWNEAMEQPATPDSP